MAGGGERASSTAAQSAVRGDACETCGRSPTNEGSITSSPLPPSVRVEPGALQGASTRERAWRGPRGTATSPATRSSPSASASASVHDPSLTHERNSLPTPTPPPLRARSISHLHRIDPKSGLHWNAAWGAGVTAALRPPKRGTFYLKEVPRGLDAPHAPRVVDALGAHYVDRGRRRGGTSASVLASTRAQDHAWATPWSSSAAARRADWLAHIGRGRAAEDIERAGGRGAGSSSMMNAGARLMGLRTSMPPAQPYGNEWGRLQRGPTAARGVRV